MFVLVSPPGEDNMSDVFQFSYWKYAQCPDRVQSLIMFQIWPKKAGLGGS